MTVRWEMVVPALVLVGAAALAFERRRPVVGGLLIAGALLAFLGFYAPGIGVPELPRPRIALPAEPLGGQGR